MTEKLKKTMELFEKQFRMPTLFSRFIEPPQRPWVGLTNDEIAELDSRFHHDTWRLLKEAEVKLKEKNT